MGIGNPADPWAETLGSFSGREFHPEAGLVALPPVFRLQVPWNEALEAEYPGLGGEFFLWRERVESVRDLQPWRWVSPPIPDQSLAAFGLYAPSMLWSVVLDGVEYPPPGTLGPYPHPEMNGVAATALAGIITTARPELRAQVVALPTTIGGAVNRLFIRLSGPVHTAVLRSCLYVAPSAPPGAVPFVESAEYTLTPQVRRWTFHFPTLADDPGQTDGYVELSAGWYLSGRAITDLLFPVFWSSGAAGNPSPWDPLQPLDLSQSLVYGSYGSQELPITPTIRPAWP